MKPAVRVILFLLLTNLSAAFAAQTQVPAGANLQQFINAAQPGDTLILAAGATYIGNFTIPNLPGSTYVTITSSALANLPPAGVRVALSDSQFMPKLVAPPGNLFSPIVQSLPGAHHFAFIGIEFAPTPGQVIYNEVLLGFNETSLSDLPHDFIFDRCYLHGDANQESKMGLVFNGVNMTAENSYLSDFKSLDWDAAAIGGWAGPGPFTIVNNYLEASTENILWGGATPSIAGVIPSDFEIRGNYMTKPLSWRQGDPSYAGTPWVVKNLLEFKVGRRITIEGNILENNWAMGQSGFAVVFTLGLQGGEAPWFVLENITFRNNIVRHASGVFSIEGEDAVANFEGHSDTLDISNNLFYDINNQKWGGPFSPVALILNDFSNISITHNTCLDSNVIAYFGGPASPGFVMENNIVPGFDLGIIADGMNQAQGVFATYSPGAIFTSNVVIGGNPASLTGTNFFPQALKVVGFVNASLQQYALTAISPFAHAASDGTDMGADFTALNAATANAIPPQH